MLWKRLKNLWRLSGQFEVTYDNEGRPSLFFPNKAPKKQRLAQIIDLKEPEQPFPLTKEPL